MVRIEILAGWADSSRLAALWPLVDWDDDGRAHGYLTSPSRSWPMPLADVGDEFLDELDLAVGVRFDTVSFQGYRDGSACCDWHYDAADMQAVISIGAGRSFHYRRRGACTRVEELWLRDGDLLFEPSGWQDHHEHRIPPCPGVTLPRLAVVFRTGSPWG